MVFYDRGGIPVAYIEDDDDIYLFNGIPVAYSFGDQVYSFSGKQLGWYENGWIRDLDGFAVLFTNDHVGGPITPLTKITPLRKLKKLVPFKKLRQLPKLRPLMKLTWSKLSDIQFFDLE